MSGLTFHVSGLNHQWNCELFIWKWWVLPKCSVKRQLLQVWWFFFFLIFFLIKSSFSKLGSVGLEISHFTYTAQARVMYQGPVDNPRHYMNCSRPKDDAWHAAFVPSAMGTSLFLWVDSQLCTLRSKLRGRVTVSQGHGVILPAFWL